MSPSDALVGTWAVEAGSVGWMFELRPDGSYQAALERFPTGWRHLVEEKALQLRD